MRGFFFTWRGQRETASAKCKTPNIGVGRLGEYIGRRQMERENFMGCIAMLDKWEIDNAINEMRGTNGTGKERVREQNAPTLTPKK
jgi:hypothetical protein